MRVETMKGGASGGTIASMLNLLEEAAADPELRKLLADPYVPRTRPTSARGPAQPDLTRPTKDDAPASGWRRS